MWYNNLMDRLFDEINLEKFIHSAFKQTIDIKSMIASSLPVGPGVTASVFLTDKGQLFMLIVSQGAMNVGDVRKMVSRANLKAEQFLPPHADEDYFTRIATKKFQEVFPGRAPSNDDDLTFYRTLVAYSPALVQISEVVDGVIKQFDRDAASSWRPAVKFSYRRIPTS
jgi:hypothetical protein